MQSRTKRGAALGCLVLGALVVGSPRSSEASTFTVGKGETLYDVAQRNGVQPWVLEATNPQLGATNLLYGDRVSIPRSLLGLAIAALSTQTPSNLLNAYPQTPDLGSAVAQLAGIPQLGGVLRTVGRVAQVANLAQGLGLIPRNPLSDLGRILTAGQQPNLGNVAGLPGVNLPGVNLPGVNLPNIPGVTLPNIPGVTLPGGIAGANLPGVVTASNPLGSVIGTQEAAKNAAKIAAANPAPQPQTVAARPPQATPQQAAQRDEDPLANTRTDEADAGPASDIGVQAIQAIQSGQLVNPNTGNRNWGRWCLALVRVAFERATGRRIPELQAGSAVNCYRAFEREGLVQQGNAPRGALIFWSPQERARRAPGSAGATHGHIAISNGDGTCISNVRRNGPFDPNGDGIGIRVPLSAFGNTQGYVVVRR
ncbi:MAG: LysM domain-containing protein [Planctomycetota bacterium]